jgi:hypothetical protein
MLAGARPAFADLTAFIGVNTTPANRPVKGLALSLGAIVFAFELEYAVANGDDPSSAPSVTTTMGNLLVQTPFPVFGLQPYVTTGGGAYREVLGARRDTSFALSTGGGIKVSLVGPLQLRVDYRVFKPGDDALYSPSHRVYVGANLRL